MRPPVVQRLLIVSAVILAGAGTPLFASEPASGKPFNVVFIAVDDLNDWVGCLGGNPQAKTPNLDRFATRAVVMNKAYCPSTVCFHKHGDKDAIDEGQWAFHEHVHPGGSNKGLAWQEKPEAPDLPVTGYDAFMWGACKASTEETKDYLACKWAADQLARDFEGKPFFMALGISKPHLPWYGGKAGGAEELYDHQADPLEHTNLATSPEHQETMARLRKHLPAHDEPELRATPDNSRKKNRP